MRGSPLPRQAFGAELAHADTMTETTTLQRSATTLDLNLDVAAPGHVLLVRPTKA